MNSTTIKACIVSSVIAAAIAPQLLADSMTFSGTGNWTEAARWDKGVPQVGDEAVIENNAHVTIDGISADLGKLTPKNNTVLTIVNSASVTVSGDALYAGSAPNRTTVFGITNSSVSLKNAYVGREVGGDIKYFQKGGSLAGTGSNFYLYGNSAAAFELEDVTANFSCANLWVGLALNGNGDPGSSMDFKNCDVTQGSALSIGRKMSSNNESTASHGRIVVSGGMWRNTSGQTIYVGGGAGSTGHFVLSNCVFDTTSTANCDWDVIVGETAGSTGRVDIAGTEVDLSRFVIPYNIGASGTLALHGRTLTDWPQFENPVSGGDTTLELVVGTFNITGDHIKIGNQKDNGTMRLRVKGGSLTTPSDKHIYVGRWDAQGGSSAGHLVLDGATASCSWLIAGHSANHPGFVDALNCSTVNCKKIYVAYNASATGAINLGQETKVNCSGDIIAGNNSGATGTVTNFGATVKTPSGSGIYVGNNAGARVWYKDGAGAMTDTGMFRVPHSGTAVAEIGGSIIANNFLIGVQNNYTGDVTVVEGAHVTATNAFCVGVRDRSGVAKLELKGGTVLANSVKHWDWNASLIGDAKSYIYFNGGTLKARSDQASNWISPDFTETAVSDGGAIFDSNGHTVYSAAALTHDSRTGAAAKDGGIVKKGAGTVGLTGALSFSGDIRVEAGTLDLSHATYAMGESAGLSGSGTLKAPAGGLSCGGKVLLDASRGTLTVNGNLTLGATATLEVENPETLDRSRSYTILSATSLSGTPAVTGLDNGWHASNTGTALRLSYSNPTTIIMR